MKGEWLRPLLAGIQDAVAVLGKCACRLGRFEPGVRYWEGSNNVQTALRIRL